MTLTDARAAGLRGLCGGAEHLPGDRDYDAVRVPWNVSVEHRPAAVVYPAFPDEVADVLRAAAAAGLQVAPQGTGHGAAPLEGRLGDAVLLRTSAMTELRVDGTRRRARVGAGVLWGDAADAAGSVGLATLHASSPDVGVVGYSLGGGLSWYSRRLGLQSSAVTAVELVLPDGTFVRACADQDAELFWALRGGGGGLGVVTAMEFDLFPIEAPTAGMLVWDWTHAERVLPAWATWAAVAPADVTTSFRIVQAPDLPDLPAEVRGRRLAVIDGAALGDDAATVAALAPLRALRPEIDTFARVPAASLVRLHLEPEGPTPGYARSALLRSLPDEAIAALLETAGPGSGSSLVIAELRQLGGALAAPDPRGGVLDHVDGGFLAIGLGVDPDPGGLARVVGDAGRMLSALEPWGTGGNYLPFLDERVVEGTGFETSAYARLQQVRERVDPGGLLVASHPD